MRKIVHLLGISIVLIWCPTLIGGGATAPVPKHLMTKGSDGGAGFPQIVDGERQYFSNWPATLGFKTDHDIFCTSTIIGRNALITAAHCVGDGRVWWADLGAGKTIKLSCDLDPDFLWHGLLSDVALCSSMQPFVAADLEYENLDLNLADLQVHANLFLLGYGCRKFPQGNELPNISAQLYGGLAEIAALPNTASDHIVTKNGVVICNGDSGGAAYVLGDTTVPTGPRSIVGTNSSYVQSARQSAITSLAGDVQKFVTSWADRRHVRICGLHPDASNCREKFVP